MHCTASGLGIPSHWLQTQACSFHTPLLNWAIPPTPPPSSLLPRTLTQPALSALIPTSCSGYTHILPVFTTARAKQKSWWGKGQKAWGCRFMGVERGNFTPPVGRTCLPTPHKLHLLPTPHGLCLPHMPWQTTDPLQSAGPPTLPS